VPTSERQALAIATAENDALRTHVVIEARGRNACVDAHVRQAQ
jgi:hypothetical protein